MLAALGNLGRLLEQLGEEILLVQRADKLVLDVLLRGVDEEVHDGLGHGILNVLAHNVKVRREQVVDQLDLELLLLARRSTSLDRHGHLLQTLRVEQHERATKRERERERER